MSSKKWLIIFFVILATFILLAGMLVVIVDPYFHYHAPLSFLEYSIDIERYMNNGIVKNFEYDAIITGTSHNENFKASEFDNLFNCNSVKVPLSGGEYKEIAEQLTIALNHNNNVKYILYGITYEDLLDDKDTVRYENLPTYLYDENIFNDYKYIFSGQAFKKIFTNIKLTINHGTTTNFDEYATWYHEYKFSKATVLASYERETNKIVSTELNEEEKEIVNRNN